MDFEKTIFVNDKLRLRKPQKSEWINALPWYSDKEVLLMSEGISAQSYWLDDINRMYGYLEKVGHLYFIEVLEADWIAVSDATFSRTSLPIVIGDERFRGKGIGRSIIMKFIEIARNIGIEELRVKEIYHYNKKSQNLFKGLGFETETENEKGSSYKLVLHVATS